MLHFYKMYPKWKPCTHEILNTTVEINLIYMPFRCSHIHEWHRIHWWYLLLYRLSKVKRLREKGRIFPFTFHVIQVWCTYKGKILYDITDHLWSNSCMHNVGHLLTGSNYAINWWEFYGSSRNYKGIEYCNDSQTMHMSWRWVYWGIKPATWVVNNIHREACWEIIFRWVSMP